MATISKQYITEKFRRGIWRAPYAVSKSPGRINIIGEHTDYNDGFVLPAAIDKYSYVAVGHRNDDEIHLFSQLFNEKLNFNLSEIKALDSSGLIIFLEWCIIFRKTETS